VAARRRRLYYRFPVYQTPNLSGAAAHEAVDAAVADAVRRQMVSDVPLGAFLSGGIDSPLVVAKMRDSGRPVRAYTIGVAGDAADESADAVAYARQLGVDHVLEQFAPDRALDWIDEVVAACGEPLADHSIFPTLLVSRLARRDMTVMLSGDGGVLGLCRTFRQCPAPCGRLPRAALAAQRPLGGQAHLQRRSGARQFARPRYR